MTRISLAAAALLVQLVLINASRSSSTSFDELTDRELTQQDNSTFIYDLSDFSVRFEKCQLVQMFDDELAQQASGTDGSPFATMHFVVFRLCPTDSCTASVKGESCGSVYGTYTLDVQKYLESTIEYQRQEFESMCAKCDEDCDEDAGQPCSGCGKICWQYANLEATGYVDAANYVQCQQLGNGDDNENNNNEGEESADDENAAAAVYIGPRCSKSGTQIRIGLFSDANCLVPMNDLNITTVLGATPSYHLLANTYSTTDNYCLSCKEAADEDGNNDNHQNDQWDDDSVNEMCENLYNGAAKCESETGLTAGFIQTVRNEQDNNEKENNGKQVYSNQVENEFMSCTFIKSLIWNSYTQSGEINFFDKQDVILRHVTKNQKIVLSLVSVAFVSMLGIVYYFQKKIKEMAGSGLHGESSAFI